MENQVKRMFIAVDSCDWETVLECFAEEVEADYSSMNGQPGGVVKTVDLVEGWKNFLPGFTHTHHQLGNIFSAETNPEGTNEGEGAMFAYVTATHYLEHEKGNVWTVVGSYDIDLKNISGEWKITKMKLNFKYQDGNAELPNVAAEAMKTK